MIVNILIFYWGDFRMKKLILATALVMGLSACNTISNVEKNVITKEQLVRPWVCLVKYDDLNMVTIDVSDFKANGNMLNTGRVIDQTFAPLKFTYETVDEGRWELISNKLVMDYDLSKRKVTKKTPKKLMGFLKQKKYQAIAAYEQGIFDILSDKSKTKADDSKITFNILSFDNDRMKIQQETERKVYPGACIVAEKAMAYLETLEKENDKLK